MVGVFGMTKLMYDHIINAVHWVFNQVGVEQDITRGGVAPPALVHLIYFQLIRLFNVILFYRIKAHSQAGGKLIFGFGAVPLFQLLLYMVGVLFLMCSYDEVASL